MLDASYLGKGITGLARAVDHNWPQGHFGCALIATWNLCATGLLSPGAEEALREELDAVIDARSHLFEPFGVAPAEPEMISAIAAPLAGRLHQLRPGGHDVIYAAFALDGLRTRQDLATAEIVQGITRLIDTVLELGPQGDFFGLDVGDGRLSDAGDPYDSETELVESALREAVTFDQMYHQIQGIVGHLLTHTHALVMLSRLGWPEIAREGHTAQREHTARVRLLHTHFDKSKWTPLEPPGPDPLDPAFWENEKDTLPDSSWGYGHFFKFRYQFYDLLRYVEDAALRQRAISHMPLLIMNGFQDQGRPPSEFMVPRPPDEGG